jgi:DNA polymerase elongation subunit (family B)
MYNPLWLMLKKQGVLKCFSFKKNVQVAIERLRKKRRHREQYETYREVTTTRKCKRPTVKVCEEKMEKGINVQYVQRAGFDLSWHILCYSIRKGLVDNSPRFIHFFSP